jgi:D-arabinose 1-dehydrogenase-like Zn-dependent alcohol dehydrogenase
MMLNRKAAAGSVIGAIAETQEMLDFCGTHGIVSDLEVLRTEDINRAKERRLKKRREVPLPRRLGVATGKIVSARRP